MKIKKLILIVMMSLFLFGAFTYANDYLNLEQFLDSYLNVIIKDQKISDTYKDIIIKYKNISKDSALYKLMQKAVYLNLFPNADLNLPLDKKVTQDQVCTIVKGKFDINIFCQKGKYVNVEWLRDILFELQDKQNQQKSNQKNVIQIKITNENYLNDSMLNDIYKILNSNYADSQTLSGKQMIYNAIKGMVGGIGDQYTVFFPPTEAKSFNEELDGEYEGIGAYVDMTKPGQLMITAPINDSPAEKAGLLAGDRVIKIDGNIVTEKIDIKTAIGWIKGPVGTFVKLTVFRNGKILVLDIKREKITIKNVYSKVYSGNICYMAISMFGYSSYNEFLISLAGLPLSKCNKYIFDVRNDPGGSLDEVTNILDFFVPTGQPSVIIKSKVNEQKLISMDRGFKLTDKNIVVLINGASASASEIFAGVIKDYGGHAKLIGEKTFGKGSVQELLEYQDGSMLKYTVAKRYTGKSKTNVDNNGLDPDIKIWDDPKTIEDEQLQYALKYQFGK